jgi:hypothetical protein
VPLSLGSIDVCNTFPTHAFTYFIIHESQQAPWSTPQNLAIQICSYENKSAAITEFLLLLACTPVSQ